MKFKFREYKNFLEATQLENEIDYLETEIIGLTETAKI